MSNETFPLAGLHSEEAFGDEKPPRVGQIWQDRWTSVVDFLGGCRPLNLIVAACAVIEAVAIAGHLLSGR